MTFENEAMVEVDVVIVGGGLGGVALAVGLQERGIQAHVFERTPKLRPHFGTGMGVGPNGLRALEGIKQGLGQRLARAGCVDKIFTTLRETQDGTKVVSVRSISDAESAISVTIPWKDAHQVLMEELDTIRVHWRHTFVDYKIVQGGVEACFKVEADDDGDSTVKMVQAKLLIGADGINSQVRKILVGDASRDLYMITWNAVIPTHSIRSLNLHGANEIRHTFYPDRKIGIMCIDVGAGRSLVQIRVPDKSGEITESLSLDLKEHGQKAKKVRAMRQMENVPGLQNLRTAFEGIDPDRIREGRSFDRLPLSSWSDPSGQVLLIGDAAHGMFPGPGQGGRQAFEDAHQLSTLLQGVFSCSAPKTAVPAAVKRFEEVRIPRVAKIQSFAAEMTTWPEYIPEWVQKLSQDEKRKRFMEFIKWTEKYPENMAGDPDSIYWKP